MGTTDKDRHNTQDVHHYPGPMGDRHPITGGDYDYAYGHCQNRGRPNDAAGHNAVNNAYSEVDLERRSREEMDDVVMQENDQYID